MHQSANVKRKVSKGGYSADARRHATHRKRSGMKNPKYTYLSKDNGF